MRKLTEDQVKEIRKRYQPGKKGMGPGGKRLHQPNSSRALAAEFGVDPAVISCIVNRKAYVDIE